jgi:predicted kinase
MHETTLPILAAPELHETHTGIVVLIGDRAYKIKKPVVTDFLDFSSAPERDHACAQARQVPSRITERPRAAATARIRDRPTTTSDATPEIAVALADGDSTWRGASAIDTGRPLPESVARAYELCCLTM